MSLSPVCLRFPREHMQPAARGPDCHAGDPRHVAPGTGTLVAWARRSVPSVAPLTPSSHPGPDFVAVGRRGAAVSPQGSSPQTPRLLPESLVGAAAGLSAGDFPLQPVSYIYPSVVVLL